MLAIVVAAEQESQKLAEMLEGLGFVRVAAGSRRLDPMRNELVADARSFDEVLELVEHEAAGVLAARGSLAPGQKEALASRGAPVVECDTGEGIEGVRQAVLAIAASLPRPSWDEYFMGIARMVARRSDCLKRRVAAIVVRERRIIATGYNGTPRGTRNCSQGGCPRCATFSPSGSNLGDCLCSHAEENAITQAALHGISVKGAVLYSTCSPCLLCTKMIINSGVGEVVYNAAYPVGERALRLLDEAGVKVRQHS